MKRELNYNTVVDIFSRNGSGCEPCGTLIFEFMRLTLKGSFQMLITISCIDLNDLYLPMTKSITKT